MFQKIRNKVERALKHCINDLDRLYSLKKISPIIFRSIQEFSLRKGKRIRPVLFIIGYLGFAHRPASGLYRSAVSLELLHDFMLVHDDIIDKSATRRGKPSMHAQLQKYISFYKNIKFSGEDLAIAIGDIMYALSIHSFLFIKEDAARKEAALKKLLEAVIYTASGEFIELISGLKDIAKISQKEVYKIYDLKTANYTFASPLASGAILAGAKKCEVDKLFQYGLYLGRAFQIKDDVLGLFQEESKIGKPNLTDIREAKKTILIWYAYQNSNRKVKSCLKKMLTKHRPDKNDLLKMRRIVTESGALDYAKKQIQEYIHKARLIITSSKMRPQYKETLETYSQKLLKL